MELDIETIKIAINLTIKNNPSSSMLQMNMRIGYNKANKIMDELERLGVIGPFNGIKQRKLLIDDIGDINLDIN